MSGTKGEPALYGVGLAAATAKLAFLARQASRWDHGNAETIARATVREYLKAVRSSERKRSANVHPDTVRMSQMLVGQDIVIQPAVARQVLHSRMKTARTLMDNPGGRWRIHEMADAVRVTRTDDFRFPERDPWNNNRAAFLASIHLGKSEIATCFKNRQSLSSNTKIAARKLLNNPNADWSAKTTNQGVRVTRVR